MNQWKRCQVPNCLVQRGKRTGAGSGKSLPRPFFAFKTAARKHTIWRNPPNKPLPQGLSGSRGKKDPTGIVLNPGRVNATVIHPCSDSRVARIAVTADGFFNLKWVKNLTDGSCYTSASIWDDHPVCCWTSTRMNLNNRFLPVQAGSFCF